MDTFQGASKIQALSLHPGTRVWERKSEFTAMPDFCVTDSGLGCTLFFCLKRPPPPPLPFTVLATSSGFACFEEPPFRLAHTLSRVPLALIPLCPLIEYGFAVLAMIQTGVISGTQGKTNSACAHERLQWLLHISVSGAADVRCEAG